MRSYTTDANARQHTARELWFGKVAVGQRRAMMSCAKFGSIDCASSCLSHRTLGEDVRRGLLLMKGRFEHKLRPDTWAERRAVQAKACLREELTESTPTQSKSKRAQ